MTSLSIGKEVCLLKQSANFCSQIIMYFSLYTDFGVGTKMATLSSGNGVFFWILPHSRHLYLGNFRWIHAGLLRGEL